MDKKELLINKGYYLTISAIEDGEEPEKVNKDKGNLKEILRKLQSLFFTTNAVNIKKYN